MTPANNIAQASDWINAGYTGTSLVPIKPGVKFPTSAGWEARTFPDDELTAGDLGLRTKLFPALDVDTDDVAVTDTIRDLLAQEGADVLIRGRTPRDAHRFAAVFQLAGWATPFTKRYRVFEVLDPITGDVKDYFRVEFLGDGQQLKVAGTHDTPQGGQYMVECSTGSVPRPEDLPFVDEGMAEDLLDKIEDTLAQEFGGLVRRKAKGSGSGSGRHGARGATRYAQGQSRTGGLAGKNILDLDDVDEDTVRELVLRHMPANTEELFPTREDVVSVAAGIWSASQGAEWGYEVFEQWACSPKGDYAGRNTESWLRKIWHSFDSSGASNTFKTLWNHYVAEVGGDPAAAAKGIFSAADSQGYSVDESLAEVGEPPYDAGSEQAARGHSADTSEVQARPPWETARQWVPANGTVPPLARFRNLTDAEAGMVVRVEDQTVYERATGTPLGGRGFPAAGQILRAQFKDDTALKYTVMQGTGKNAKPVEKTKSIADWLAENQYIPRVATIGYFPGAPEFYTEAKSGTRVWNRWRADPCVREKLIEYDQSGAVTFPHGGVRGGWGSFVLLVRALFEATREPEWAAHAELFLDWCATVVCHPAVKPGHHYLMAGGQGIGKSLIMWVLSQLVGEANAESLDVNTLASEFRDFLKSKLVMGDEMYVIAGDTNRGGRQAYNAMKSYMARTPAVLGVNVKMQRPERAQNTHAWIMATNSSAGSIRMDEDDRRLAVVEVFDMPSAQFAQAKSACAEIGAAKDAGCPRDWQEEMAAALVERFAAVWDDPARWEAVMGPPPVTDTKSRIAMEDRSPLADAILSAWEDGLIPDITSVGEVQAAVAGRRNLPSVVANAAASRRYVSEALGEAGAARGTRVRFGGGGRGENPVVVWVMPSTQVSAAPHPSGADDADRVSETTKLDRIKRWRAEVSSFGADILRDMREEALARFNK